jgi:hypothetical protein
MTFLLHSTVNWDGKKSDYNIYEFKLVPLKYKAELISSNVNFPIKEIVFWKSKKGWQTSLKSKAAKYTAEVLGNDIDNLKN